MGNEPYAYRDHRQHAVHVENNLNIPVDLSAFDYRLPPELIRRVPLEPRDRARLFVYDTGGDRVTHAVFRDLADHLPERSLLVLNDTRVVPARLWLRKPTGGKIEVFVLANMRDPASDEIPFITDRRCEKTWKLAFPDGSELEVLRHEGGKFFGRLHASETLETLLERYGETPVPHYLEDQSQTEDMLRQRYQTVFARSGASVAAPTAALHFTDALFAHLAERRIGRADVTLDVGQGTFAPITEEHFTTGTLHQERYTVTQESAAAINQARAERRPIVPVGTTAMRVLESATDQSGTVRAGSAVTDIFIRPGYRFRMAGALVTNFHLPRTSLMLLVQAFLEQKRAPRSLVSLYEEAILERYAFYSFGDAMLIR